MLRTSSFGLDSGYSLIRALAHQIHFYNSYKILKATYIYRTYMIFRHWVQMGGHILPVYTSVLGTRDHVSGRVARGPGLWCTWTKDPQRMWVLMQSVIFWDVFDICIVFMRVFQNKSLNCLLSVWVIFGIRKDKQNLMIRVWTTC